MESRKLGMWKGYHLSIKGIRKGYLFCQMVYERYGVKLWSGASQYKSTPPPLPRLNISIQELEWAYKQRFERNTHIDLRSISRIKFELESLLQDLTRPWKNILTWIFQGRYNIFQSLWGGGHRFTPTVNHVFFWLLELKCRSSKKQGWVGRPPAASLLGSHADVLGGASRVPAPL